jgi:hypothetical protein
LGIKFEDLIKNQIKPIINRMKNRKITLLFLALTLLAACQNPMVAQQNERRSKSISTHTISHSNDRENYSICYDGEITFADDDRSLRSIGNNGYLKFKTKGKEVLAEADNQGNLVYSFIKGSGSASEAKAWLEANIGLLIKSGVGAKARVNRLYEQKGANGVIDAIDNLNGDFVQKIYFDHLLKQAELSDNQLVTVANKIAEVIESDFELSNLLVNNSARFFKNPAVSEAYIKAIEKIDSDFEQAKVIKSVMGSELKLSDNQFNRLVEVAATKIDSDFEKANVLKKILANPLTDSQLQKVIEGTNQIDSDFEASNVLKQILDKTISDSQFQLVMDGISKIDSDFEASNVLKKALNNRQLSEKQFTQAIQTIQNIDSDFEKANVLKTAIARNQPTDNQTLDLLESIKTIDSDFEKSNVLLKLSEKMPKNNNKIRSAYLTVAKTINSDFEYGKVMRAVE